MDSKGRDMFPRMHTEIETPILAYRGLSDEEDEGAMDVPDGDELVEDGEGGSDDGTVDDEDEEDGEVEEE